MRSAASVSFMHMIIPNCSLCNNYYRRSRTGAWRFSLDASHTQNLAKLAWLRRPRLCFSFGELFASALWRGLRHGYVSPSPCSFRSLYDRDALPFNRLMRNFKRNSACYERQWRNFDRIELRRRSRRNKTTNSKRDRRSRADSVETLRIAKAICVLHPVPVPANYQLPTTNYQLCRLP